MKKDMDLRARFFLENLKAYKTLGGGRLEDFDYKNIYIKTERDYRYFLKFSDWIGDTYEANVIDYVEETLAKLYPADQEGES